MLHCPDLFDIRGFSANFGNGPIDKTYPILKDLVDFYYGDHEKKPKVHKGAAKSVMSKLEADINAQKHEVVGVENEAAHAIIAALEEVPDGETLNILATGPLTNIAETVLICNQQKKPYLLDRIGTIYVCGGVRSFKDVFKFGTEQPVPFSDMNFDYDPMAVLIVLQHKLDVVFAGFEVATKWWMTEKCLDRLKQNGDKICKKFVNCSALNDEVIRWKSWGNIYQQEEPHDTKKKIEGVCPSDLFTTMYMIAPELFDVYEQDVYYGMSHVNNPGFDAKPIFKPYLVCPTDEEAAELCGNWGVVARSQGKYVYGIKDPERFERVVLSLLEKPHYGTDFIKKIQ